MKRIVIAFAALAAVVLASATPAMAQQYYGNRGGYQYQGQYQGRNQGYSYRGSYSQPRTSVGISIGNFSAGYGGYGRNYGYSGPVYHAPSVHLDRVYHPEYTHWTPSRGLHTHGHYDVVPHYVPGHYDYQHGNHIHSNPHFDH